MHFEPANKEKKKMSPLIPAALLVLWIVGSTWYWMCGVKDMCGDSVIEEHESVEDVQLRVVCQSLYPLSPSWWVSSC